MVNRAKVLRVIAATALSGWIASAALPAQAGEWVVDTKSGCRVWDPNPQLEEAVTWSGSCADGRAEGQGIVQWSKAGTPFETDAGEWHDGRQVHKGTQSWPAGRYEGELVDGEPNGHGILTLQKERYEGVFRDGKPNGSGTLIAGTETLRGIWKDGCLQGQRKASIGVPLSACR
jgi:hypothetical protein